MVFTLSPRKHHRKENIVTACVCIYFKMETFPINFLNYICTSTTIYQIYFGERSTYKNNTDWTGVV